MKLRLPIFLLSLLSFGVFVVFSYTVAKEAWQSIDFDTTVKLQGRMPRKLDSYLSYFSLLGSAEITFLVAGVLAGLSLIRLKLLAVLGWLIIIPTSVVEVFGKLFLFHPGTPVLFHRSAVATHLPSFYIETNFSYPSGHMTRSIFLVTVFLIVVIFSSLGIYKKFLVTSFLISFGLIMAVSRVSLGEHWLSDVIGGSMLGVSAGLLASILILRKRKKTNHLPD